MCRFVEPRLYARVNEDRSGEHSDYMNYNVEWNLPTNYEIVKRIGWGKYSNVFEGVDLLRSTKCVIKVLKPVSAKKVKREIKILRNLTDGPNIIKLVDIVRDPQSRVTSLIFEFVSNTDFKVLYPKLSDNDIRYYTFQILKALDFSHMNGIMHRDVKPHNVMIDHETKKLRLIDWGLAEFYFPRKDNNVRVASQHYKGPELLVDMKLYDYSLDMWSLGCVLAGMIFRKDPFFKGRNNQDQLFQIVKVLGTVDFFEYVKTYDIKLDDQVKCVLNRLPRQDRKRLEVFISQSNHHLVSPDSIDLLNRMLQYDHNQRILPRDALHHPFFEPIREEDKKRCVTNYTLTEQPSGNLGHDKMHGKSHVSATYNNKKILNNSNSTKEWNTNENNNALAASQSKVSPSNNKIDRRDSMLHRNIHEASKRGISCMSDCPTPSSPPPLPITGATLSGSTNIPFSAATTANTSTPNYFD